MVNGVLASPVKNFNSEFRMQRHFYTPQKPVTVAQWSLRKEETKAIFKKHMKLGAWRTDTLRFGAWDLILNPKIEKPADI